MTNEELIEALTTLKEQARYYGDNTFIWSINIDSFNFVINSAIKDLEQEPTTKNNIGVDCIDRQATLDAIIKRLGIKNETYLLEAERVIYQQILAMPSVTPQSRKGHWIECMAGGAEEWCYKCSECNFWKYKKTINLSKFKFCPNCGSRNEVEE